MCLNTYTKYDLNFKKIPNSPKEETLHVLNSQKEESHAQTEQSACNKASMQ